MSIKENWEKVKGIRVYEKELFVACLIILVALLAFGLGRLSKIESARQPVRVEGADEARD